MKKLLTGILAVVTAMSLGHMSTYAEKYTAGVAPFSVDFEGQTVGAKPTGITTSNGVITVEELDGESCLKVLAYASGYNAANVSILNPYTTSTQQTVSAHGAVVASARYYFPEALDCNRQIMVYLMSDSTSNRICQPFNIYNGSIYKGANQATMVLDEYPVGEWFTLKYTVVGTQPGTADGYGKLEMEYNGATTVLYSSPLSEIGAGSAFPNNAISIWQHTFNTKNTQNGVNDAPHYYIDDMKLENISQRNGLDEDFDNDYYTVGKSPSKVTFKNDATNGLNISVADVGGEHNKVLKFAGTYGAFKNTNNLMNVICKDQGNVWIYENDMYFAQPMPSGATMFPLLRTGDGSGTTTAFQLIPYSFYNNNIYSQLNGGGTLLAACPIGEWFKMRVTYAFSNDWGNDTVIVQMIDDEGNVTELYKKTRAQMDGFVSHNGKQFPYFGVGEVVYTVADKNTSNVYYMDNFKLYTTSLPSTDNLTVNGVRKLGEKLTASYDFNCGDGGFDASEYAWYRGSKVLDGTSEKVEIARGIKEYTVTADDIGRNIYFEILPKSSNGLVALNPSSYTVTIPEIVYDFDVAGQLNASFTKQEVNAAITQVEYEGRKAISVAPAVGVTGTRGGNITNRVPMGGFTSGSIILSEDYFVKGVLGNGSTTLKQILTQGSTQAGTYSNAYWFKGDKIYAPNGNTVLCDLPIGEWFTMKVVLEPIPNTNTLTFIIVLKTAAEEKVICDGKVAINGIPTAGIKYTRTSYSVGAGDDNELYIDNISFDNSYGSGIYNANAVQDGNDVKYTAKIVDYGFDKGVLIVKDNGTDNFKVKIEKLDAMNAEEDVEVVIKNAKLGDGFGAYVWNSFNGMVPVLGK